MTAKQQEKVGAIKHHPGDHSDLRTGLIRGSISPERTHKHCTRCLVALEEALKILRKALAKKSDARKAEIAEAIRARIEELTRGKTAKR